MRLNVNDKETEAKDGCTIAELADQLTLPAQGVAIAVNNRMIPRTEWTVHALKTNDNLIVIKAACGG